MEDNRKIMAIKINFGSMIIRNSLEYYEANNYTYRQPTLLTLLEYKITY